MKSKQLKIKVCGMKHQQNVDDLLKLDIDYFGNIFFDGSPRYINKEDPEINVNSALKVGVFVNETIDEIQIKRKKHKFDIVQLHGAKSNEICKRAKEVGLEVWRVCSIYPGFNFSELERFPDADFFLFDNKTEKHGGSGKKFDWDLLERIDNETPKKYFLAGGIESNDASIINNLNLKNIYGLDLNSRFENKPGVKNVKLIEDFLRVLRK